MIREKKWRQTQGIIYCSMKAVPGYGCFLTSIDLKQARRSLFIFLLMAYLSVCYWVKSASLSQNGNQPRESKVVMWSW
jgi:hypothetical protein